MLRSALLALSLWMLSPAALTFAQHDHDHQDEAEVEGEAHDQDAEAAHHGGPVHLSDILKNTEFWAAVINFSLLVIVLVRMGKKPVSEFLVQRRREMEAQMAEAAEMKAKADARYQEYTQRLASLDKELATLEANIVAGAQEDKKRIVAEAEETAQRLKRETESLIDQHRKALSAEIRNELVAAAVAAAEKAMREAITANDQQQLAERFKQALLEASKNGAAKGQS